MDDDLTLLGRDHRGPVDHVETFAAPEGCTKVVFWNTVQPQSVDVVVTQHVRGGIVTETHSSHPR